MRKVIAILAIVALLGGCAGWKQMSAAQKWSATSMYYHAFVTGLEKFIPYALALTEAISPETKSIIEITAQPIIDKAAAAANRLDTMIAQNASDAELKEQVAKTDAAVKQANQAVAEVKAQLPAASVPTASGS